MLLLFSPRWTHLERAYLALHTKTIVLNKLRREFFGTRRTGNESTFQFVSAGTFKERLPAEQYSTEPTRGDVHRIAAPRKTEFSLISWVEA